MNTRSIKGPLFLVLITIVPMVISCERFSYSNSSHHLQNEHFYKSSMHPSIVLQLLEDNKNLFTLSGILEIILKLLNDLEEAFENPTKLQEVELCAYALEKYLISLKNLDMWALKMVDAGSKIQSGLLSGNFISLGQYDQCVKINVPFAQNYVLQGKHCLIDFKISLPSNLTFEIDGVKEPISRLLGSNTLTLTMGQCFPSDCTSNLLEYLFNTAVLPINYFVNGTGYNVAVSIASSDCHQYSKGDYTIAEWIVLIIIVIIIFTALVCTIADITNFNGVTSLPTHPGIKILLAFSVTRNFKKLISTQQSADTMASLNGIKVLSILWVVLGHRYRYLMSQPIVNFMDIADQVKNWTKMFILSAPLSVDTFFLISGLLNMYVFCNIREKKKNYTPVELITTYIHRYIRLTPAYAIMIAITATWLYRFGSGPMWDRLVGEARDECVNGWWENIIYLNNYINPDTYCMMQSWYLAADMQMFWLSPLVIYPLWRWPLFGYVEIFILIIASVASPFLVSYSEGIKTPIPMTTNAAEQAKQMDELYLPTHTKTMGYVIGILTGYILFNLKKGKYKFRMNKIFSILLWAAAATCFLYALFGGYQIVQLDSAYSKGQSAFYIGFYKLFWSLGLMWLIISCIMGYGGMINSLLSIRIFGPLGRLTYCIYLTHVAVILCDIGSRRTASYYSDYSTVQAFFGDIVFILIFATILSVLLESPLMTIEKIIFGRRETPRRRGEQITQERAVASVSQAGPSTGEPQPVGNLGGENIKF